MHAGNRHGSSGPYHRHVSRPARLTLVLLLNLGLVAGLVIVGLAAHSLAVLAAGADYLADATAIAMFSTSSHPALTSAAMAVAFG